jgi:hypothetical protein
MGEMRMWLRHATEALAAVGMIVFLASLIGLVAPWLVVFFAWYFQAVLG